MVTDRAASVSSRLLTVAIALSWVAASAPARSQACELSARDEAGIRQAVAAYRTAWLANDADAVLSTLSDDVVLQPAHGLDPVVGAEAARAWWFPESAPFTITDFTIDVRGIDGCGRLAYAWGRSAVWWTDPDGKHSNEGNLLSILTRDADGPWLIAQQIWNNPLTVTE
ncbi:MAG: SgcJ/EcaC family oxidoreductase [Thermoanaerobaculia bacterium]